MNEAANVALVGTNVIFSAVVAWYLLSKALPNMHERFSRDLAQQSKEFQGALIQQRGDFAESRKADQAYLERITGMQAARHEAELEAIHGLLTQLSKSQETLARDQEQIAASQAQLARTIGEVLPLLRQERHQQGGQGRRQ